MFYGITRKRGRGAGRDIYSIYEPWEDPASYGGVVWFEAGGKSYRLRRDFYKESPRTELLDEEDWRECDPEDLEELMEGVSQAVYENTVSVGQLRSVTGPDLARELTNYMAATQGAADSRISLDKAAQFLKMHRKGFMETKDRNSRELKKSFDKMEGQEEYLNRELREIEQKTADLLRRKEELLGMEQTLPQKKDQEAKKALEEFRTRNRRLMGAAGLTGLMAFVLLLAGFFGHAGIWHIMIRGGVSLTAFVLCFLCLARGQKIDKRHRHMEAAENRSRKKILKREADLEKMTWDFQNLANMKQDRLAAVENLGRDKAEYEAALDLPSPEDEEIEAINLALEKIDEASGAIRGQLGTRLRERTSEILCEITDGKYSELLVDDQFHIRVNLESRLVDLERLSRGTVEQVYFALRMASGELMCGEERLPVILDDVFGMYDEERLAAVLHWLEAQNRQIIICTCSHREEEIMQAENIRYTGFEL